MAVELAVVLLKLKLLASAGAGAGGDPHCHLHVALLWFFLLKLPLATRARRGSRCCADMVFAVRLFLFRLNRVLFPDEYAPPRNGRRWERALRLFRERATEDARFLPAAHANEDSLHAFSMLSL